MESAISTIPESNNNFGLKSDVGSDCNVSEQAYFSRSPNPSQAEVPDIIDESDVAAFERQMAGHDRTGVLKHKLGYVLKPVQAPPLGPREVEFYRKLFDPQCSEQTRLRFREFLPGFHGVTKVISSTCDSSTVEYMVLDDAVQGFRYPCIVDVKIGEITWDPLASAKKIQHEKSKYAGTKSQLGFAITGMQHFDLTTGRVVKRAKDFGKQLDVDSLHTAWKEFFNINKQVHTVVLPEVLKRLVKLKEIFAVQTEFAFYSSSILIAYDAAAFTNRLGEMHEIAPDDICVKMIDFAHVFPADNSLDQNYLFGLNNLIQSFENLVNASDANQI